MTRPRIDPDLTGTDPDLIDHGTYGGYQQQNRRGIPPCDDCRAAVATYQRRYRSANGYRDVRRDQHARRYVLAQIRDLAPDLYTRLYREAAREWEQAHPYPMETT